MYLSTQPKSDCGCGCKGAGTCGDSGDGLSGLPFFPAGQPLWQQLLFIGVVGGLLYYGFHTSDFAYNRRKKRSDRKWQRDMDELRRRMRK